jgi:hypothetical protein
VSPTPDCADLRELLGAHVLGGLEPDETHLVEQHLEKCPGCRTEHSELVAAPALLDLARDAPPDVPTRVRDRIVAAAAARQVRRRWTLVAAAAAVVVGHVAGAVGWQLAPAPQTEIAVPLETIEPFEASGWAIFDVEGDRVTVRLELDGMDPLAEPEVYEAWMYTHDERIVSIGQLSDVDGAVTVEFTAPGSLDDYRGFWITAEPDWRDPAHEGETVLRAAVPDRR